MRSRHRVWAYGDHVNTDVIFPGKYTYSVQHDPAALSRHALEDLDPSFASGVQPGDVIVAGRNWGNGSSREQAVTCLLACGLRAVIAESFARIYFRNAINNGLLALACPGVAELAQSGSELSLDLDAGELVLAGETLHFTPLPPSVRHIVAAGGLIASLKAARGQ
ncbi:MAG: 3-isopropylmalate dehydratase [Anaerolineaceae bacterium]|nr:3-isopropylmalate dehydratase [Anaerolineaceae bacterium]MDE0328341.1 3-isopropylmalate dehydratase [Anaerolineaceae bacterium]